MATIGLVTVPVLFGNKTYKWTFSVMKRLICPLILGTDILDEAIIDLKNRKVHIDDQSMPITLTLNELLQPTAIASVNRVIPPYGILTVTAVLM